MADKDVDSDEARLLRPLQAAACTDRTVGRGQARPKCVFLGRLQDRRQLSAALGRVGSRSPVIRRTHATTGLTAFAC